MDLSIKQIFLGENEKDIFARLSQEGIDTKAFASKFQYLFQKVYNNEVGYYSFRQDKIIYKLIVLPKTISHDDENKEKDFVNYLLHYYRVNNKYGFDKTKKIPDSILSLAFESNNKDDKVYEPLELFEFHKSKSILKSIEAFFQKHKNYQRVEQDYISQSVKHRLNLAKNIKEINKTKIHQRKYVDLLYSQIATVAYFALKLYAQKRLKYLSANTEELQRQVHKISSLIARKYMIDKRFSLSIPKLYSHKIGKLFQKKDEYKILLANLQSLFGYEQLFSGKKAGQLRHDLYTSSFFIDPSQFYEWYVYDILKNYAKANNFTLKFAGNEETIKKYFINKKEAKSKPDFILIDRDEKINIVLDTKWKQVSTISDIKDQDYLKLQFDEQLLKNDNFATVGYLIYPQVGLQTNKIVLKQNDKTIYRFNILEIDMDFADKEKNCLDFKYDFTKQQKELVAQEQKELTKQEGLQSTKSIEPQRVDAVGKLIKATTEEEKEELRETFDDVLLKQNQLLAKSLEEIILPEIEEILDQFGDILEEQSITFLKSTSTIYAHYQNEEIIFDFSMPGSGLWKTIELELNTSFIWLLRIMSNVCDSQSPWMKVCKLNAKIDQDLDSGKKVALSMSDKKDRRKLQSVMLGGIKLLVEDRSTIKEFDSYFQNHPEDKVFIETLPKLLKEVIEYRNEHAHIKAMTKEKFKEFWNYLFVKDPNQFNHIEQLFLFKKNMKNYIADHK